MSTYFFELSPEDIRFFQAIHDQREQESQAWLKVKESLTDYISRFVDTSGEAPSDVENLISMFLPDLVDEIVEEIQGGEA